VITGVHAVYFSSAVEELRSFFGTALDMPSVDAGDGWPIFALPPAELAVHPSGGEDRVELYLMCDDVRATLAELVARGAGAAGDVVERSWGWVSSITLPGGSSLGIYQPKHPVAHATIDAAD
jgi:hypothetical protein